MKRTAPESPGSALKFGVHARSNGPGARGDATPAKLANGANAAGATINASNPRGANLTPELRSSHGNSSPYPYSAPADSPGFAGQRMPPPGNGLQPAPHLAYFPEFTQGGPPVPASQDAVLWPPAGSPNPCAQIALSERAAKAVTLGRLAWEEEWLLLKAEERTCFLTLGLQLILGRGRPMLCPWRVVMLRACRELGAEALLAQDFLPAIDLIFLLIGLDLHEFLADIVRIEAGKHALVEANKRDITPLHLAAAIDNSEAARLVLDCTDDAGMLRMKPTTNGLLPLHCAAAVAAIDVARCLLQDQGKEQRLAPATANTLPIHIVMLTAGNAAMVRLLLEDCAQEQTINRVEPEQSTALMLAAGYGLAAIVEALLEVEPTLAQQLAMRDSKGRSALDHAKQSGNAATIKLLEDAMRSLPAASSSSASTATTPTPAHASNAAPLPPAPYPATPAPLTAGREEEELEVEEEVEDENEDEPGPFS